MRASIPVVFALFLCVSGTAQAASCPLTGLYSGGADLVFGRTDVTLNLYCDNGKPASRLYTSIGDYDTLSTEADAAHVVIGFGTRGNPATLTLTVKGDTLSGAVDLAGPKGTVALTRTGDSTGADALAPRLDLTAAQWQE